MANLQAAYDELATAIASGNLPVLVSLDTNNPIVYKIGIARGANKVLEYDLGATDMVAVADYAEGNVLQGWYFTLGSNGDQAFIHPYVGGGDVLAAKSTGNAPAAVWAAAKGSMTHQEWTIPQVTEGSYAGAYNIKAADGSNYFSNNGGTGNKMGFWGSDNTTDTGSLFTFERISIDGGIWNHTLTQFVNRVCDATEFPETPQLGYITRNDAYDNAYNNAVAVKAGEATESELKEAYTTLRSEFEGLDVYKPEAGKFYRIKNNGGTGYLSSGTGTGRTQFVEGIDNAASSVFYYTGSKLLSYENGMYLANGSNFLCYTNTVGDVVGTVITFKASPVDGKLLIEFNNGGRSFYSAGTGESNAAGAGQTGESYRFTVEEVTSLPVTISSVGYATLYAPVALTVPNGLEAYVATETGSDYVNLAQVEEGVIPANTGVLIKVNGATKNDPYNFDIAPEANEQKSLFKGTIAKSLITPVDGTTCYVLANGEKGVGLYKATLNQSDDTAFYNNANKVYLPVPTPVEQSARALSFRFGGEGTTEIEPSTLNSQPSTIIYDLQGRRVENPTKGMYIVNGKKVIVK